MLFEVKNKEGEVLYATDKYNSRREAAQAILAQVRGAGWCLDGAIFHSTDLCRLDFSQLSLREARFVACHLDDALFCSANLSGAEFNACSMVGANFRKALATDLRLTSVNATHSNWADAYLEGARISSTTVATLRLDRAEYLGDVVTYRSKLVGDHGVRCFGPIGSRNDHLTAIFTERGIVLETGCFCGGIQEFEASLQETHKDAEFLSEYRHALRLIRAIARREGAPIDLQYWTETNKTAG